ncbi:hypothetical protein ACI7RC_25125 [Brevibacillus sp. B_LB10_24]|uniref:hypothetical protein n=1 Tax=Brevibacillus sp. B_LB10_24 TaxID=3380645 RepID=UPI0038BA5632
MGKLPTVMIVLLLFAAVVVVIGFILSLMTIRKQQHHEVDQGTNRTILRHPVMANPVLLAYILFPIVVVIGVVVYLYYFY